MSDRQYTVYVAEDDEDDIETLVAAFKYVDCSVAVYCYSTAAAMIRQLSPSVGTTLPDLILLDHHLQYHTGVDLVGFITGQERFNSIALVIYATVLQETKKNDLLRVGVDCLLVKGNTLHDVREHVKTFCAVMMEKKRSTAAGKDGTALIERKQNDTRGQRL